jgi:hypothetical protein
MTDEQINAAIAEACGWTDFVVHPEFGLMGTPPDTHGLRTAVDYYTADLNAMHEAEKGMEAKTSMMFGGWLLAVCKGKNATWHATARQRAEAFLKTLGKWDDQSGDATEMVKEVQK